MQRTGTMGAVHQSKFSGKSHRYCSLKSKGQQLRIVSVSLCPVVVTTGKKCWETEHIETQSQMMS